MRVPQQRGKPSSAPRSCHLAQQQASTSGQQPRSVWAHATVQKRTVSSDVADRRLAQLPPDAELASDPTALEAASAGTLEQDWKLGDDELHEGGDDEHHSDSDWEDEEEAEAGPGSESPGGTLVRSAHL